MLRPLLYILQSICSLWNEDNTHENISDSLRHESHVLLQLARYTGILTSGSAMAEGRRDALVSRNSATTKHPI